jgi:hypothetical protein
MALAVVNRRPLFPVLLMAIGAGALYYGQIRGHDAVSYLQQSRQVVTRTRVQQDPPAQRPVLAPPGVEGPKIQVAILLDTSSSMSGLIDQARAELWTMVNAMDGFSKDGQQSHIEIAVYEYGNSGLDGQTGYLRQVTPFSGDLDAISEGLFSLTTNGGSEHAGQVIDAANQELNWRLDDDTVRAIYIAGNESFEQGPTPFAEAIANATERGITVNTIYCGDENQGRQEQWHDGARLGGGQYLAINHNHVKAYREAPQDAEIAELGRELNATYVYYGSGGQAAYDNQRRQDDNAASAGLGSLIQRSVSKSSRTYNNYGWDLVDATEQGRLKIADVDRETLPEGYRGLSADQLEKKVEAQSAKRKEIQTRLAELRKEREAFLANAGQEAGAEAATLDAAMISALQSQASELGFEFQ